MATLPLTAKQEQLWRFIQSCERSPSFEEMSLHMYGRTTGKGAIHVLTQELERRGYLRRDPLRARSIVAVVPCVEMSHISTADLASELARRLAA
jgi:SOS-response transcriptional repressor LexA